MADTGFRKCQNSDCNSAAERAKEAENGAGVAGLVLKQCARCRGAWYCSVACQRADWKIHKSSCLSKLPPSVEKTGGPVARGGDEKRDLLQWICSYPFNAYYAAVADMWKKRSYGCLLTLEGWDAPGREHAMRSTILTKRQALSLPLPQRIDVVESEKDTVFWVAIRRLDRHDTQLGVCVLRLKYPVPPAEMDAWCERQLAEERRLRQERETEKRQGQKV